MRVTGTTQKGTKEGDKNIGTKNQRNEVKKEYRFTFLQKQTQQEYTLLVNAALNPTHLHSNMVQKAFPSMARAQDIFS